MRKMNRFGFTLGELMLAVAIIGILVGVTLPMFSGTVEKQKESADVTMMREAHALASSQALVGIDFSSVKYFDGNASFSNTPVGAYGKGTATDKGETYGVSSCNDCNYHPESGYEGKYIIAYQDGDGNLHVHWTGSEVAYSGTPSTTPSSPTKPSSPLTPDAEGNEALNPSAPEPPVTPPVDPESDPEPPVTPPVDPEPEIVDKSDENPEDGGEIDETDTTVAEALVHNNIGVDTYPSVSDRYSSHTMDFVRGDIIVYRGRYYICRTNLRHNEYGGFWSSLIDYPGTLVGNVSDKFVRINMDEIYSKEQINALEEKGKNIPKGTVVEVDGKLYVCERAHNNKTWTFGDWDPWILMR